MQYKICKQIVICCLMHVCKNCKQNMITKKRKRNASAVGFKLNAISVTLHSVFCFANSLLRKHEQRNQRPERRQQRLGGGMPKSGSGASSPPPLAPQSAPPPPQSPFGPGGGHTHLPALLPVILLQVDFIHQQVNFAKTPSVLYEVQLQRTVAV